MVWPMTKDWQEWNQTIDECSSKVFFPEWNHNNQVDKMIVVSLLLTTWVLAQGTHAKSDPVAEMKVMPRPNHNISPFTKPSWPSLMLNVQPAHSRGHWPVANWHYYLGDPAMIWQQADWLPCGRVSHLSSLEQILDGAMPPCTQCFGHQQLWNLGCLIHSQGVSQHCFWQIHIRQQSRRGGRW